MESLFCAFTLHIHGLFVFVFSSYLTIQHRSCNKMCKIPEIQSLKKWSKAICCFPFAVGCSWNNKCGCISV